MSRVVYIQQSETDAQLRYMPKNIS